MTERPAYATPPNRRLAEPRHTREYHQQLLDVWHTGSVGFLPHRYRRCGFSGAGNCCCGRPDRAALHNDGVRQP